MGAAISTAAWQPPTRTLSIEIDDFHTVNISNEVIDKLRNQHKQNISPPLLPLLPPESPPISTQTPSSNHQQAPHRTVPDVGNACCCLHAPLNRPTAQLDEVLHELRPLEAEHQRQQDAHRERIENARRPLECDLLQAQLMQCYRNCGGRETLHCAQYAQEFNACLRRHQELLGAKLGVRM